MLRSRIRISLALLILTSWLPVQAQDHSPLPFTALDSAPSVLPSGCSIMHLIGLSQAADTQSAKLLIYELSAFSLGHMASQQMMDAMTMSPDSQATLQSVVLHLIVTLEDAKSNYLCASYTIGQFKPENDNESTVRKLLIIVFNRMYLETSDLEESFTNKSEEVERGENGSAVAGAKRIAAILADRKDAASDLLNAIGISGMLAMDVSGPADISIKYVSMGCSSYQMVLRQALDLTSEKRVDEFTRYSALIVSALKSKKCKLD